MRVCTGLVAFLTTLTITGPGAAQSLEWTQVSESSPWGTRVLHAINSFQGDIFISGGLRGPSTFLHHQDMWRLDSDHEWTPSSQTPQWSARSGHVVLVFEDALWIFGGRTHIEGNESIRKRANDIWRSEDGATWEFMGEAPWYGRNRHAGIVFNNRVWIMAGTGPDGYLNDVWSSPNGVDWVLETSAAPWQPRFSPSLVEWDGRLWLIGGGGYPDTNDIWSTLNGKDWNLEKDRAAWSPRRGQSVVVYDDYLWLLGGRVFHQFNSSEIWRSSDGIHWRLSTARAPWGRRSVHTCVVHEDKLWFMAGEEFFQANRKSDVWYAVLNPELPHEGELGDGEGELTTEGEGEGATNPTSGALQLDLSTATDSYAPGATTRFSVEVSGSLNSPLTAFGFQLFLPDGWRYGGALTGDAPGFTPTLNAEGTLEFAYLTPPELPFTFHFSVWAPEEAIGPKLFGGIGLYRTVSAQQETNFDLVQVLPSDYTPHDADSDGDGRISLSEILRVVQFFNIGAYHCSEGTEDGFAPGHGPQCDTFHSSDFAPADWSISLSELLRLIQFYNSGGYASGCEDSEDSYCPVP